MHRSPDGRRRVTLLVAVLLVVSPALPADTRDQLPRLRGRVVGIADGDTIDVRLESGMLRVRLHGVDAPEHDQPWGRAAKRALSKLVYREKVEIEPVTQDQYERIVARVWLDGRDVNTELVRKRQRLGVSSLRHRGGVLRGRARGTRGVAGTVVAAEVAVGGTVGMAAARAPQEGILRLRWPDRRAVREESRTLKSRPATEATRPLSSRRRCSARPRSR